MKKILLYVIAAAMTLGTLPASAGEGPASFTFDGAGWGHGVGFSQWGARGQTLEDPAKLGEDIAAYYYPGSEPGTLTDLDLENDLLQTMETPIWVNLQQEVTILEFTGVGGPLDLCLANDGAGDCPKPEHPQAGEAWEFRRIDVGQCAFFKDDVQQGTTGDCRASITWPDAAGVQLRDLSRSEKICKDGDPDPCEYRHGEIKLRDDPDADDIGFHVVLAVGLEDYIKGIREVPDGWTEVGVNQAQAVAARTYAAYKFYANETESLRPANLNADPGISDGRKDSCWCHLYDDWTDMQYAAWDKESEAPHWADAVDATAGRVLTYFGTSWQSYTQAGILQAFFSASSGGYTNTNVLGFNSVWDGAAMPTAWPYLTTVADSWATDPQWGNPNASWSEVVQASTIASLLGWDEVTAAALDAGPPEPVVRFTGADGGETVSTTVAGRWLRVTLGLSSSMVTAIDGVGAEPPPPPGPFDDIEGSGHGSAILAIFDAGITLGCSSTSYCPLDSVTRGQMASFISRAMDLPDPAGDHFSDDDGTTHETAINQLYEAAITFGCGEGAFCPDDHVTRAQMAAFLARSLNLTTVSGDYFTDDEGSQFEPSINAVAAAGITLGCDVDRFCPDDPVTRAQMASFLERAYLP